jgi:quinate dehydrogenase
MASAPCAIVSFPRTGTYRLVGVSVTMPHKVAILKHLNGVTPEAVSVGAVNPLFKQEDSTGKRLYMGTNTDVVGIREPFLVTRKSISGSRWRRRSSKEYDIRPTYMDESQHDIACMFKLSYERLIRLAFTILQVNRDAEENYAILAEKTARGYGANSMIHVSTASHALQLEGVGAIVACVPNFNPKISEEHEARRV